MLDRNNELRFLEFLSVLAGLIGIVVSVSQFQIGNIPPTIVRAYFSVILVFFFFASALTFLRSLQGKDVAGLNWQSSAISQHYWESWEDFRPQPSFPRTLNSSVSR